MSNAISEIYENRFSSEIDDLIHDESEADDVTPMEKHEITYSGADLQVADVVRRLGEGELLIPDWQRGYIWTMEMASRFIESFLLDIPVPGVFLGAEPESNYLYVIDGQQRLKTLQYFYSGEFHRPNRRGAPFNLVGVQREFAGLTYDLLSVSDQFKLDNSLIHATVITPVPPFGGQTSMYQVFKRLNTGGLAINPQEIRSAIYGGRLLRGIRDLNDYPEWRAIVGEPSPRMKDQEMILRFMAMWHRGDSYNRSMTSFLNEFTEANQNPDNTWMFETVSIFKRAIKAFAESKGREAFRLRKSQAINAAVFDSMTVGLARRISGTDAPPEENLVRKTHDALLANEQYLRHVQQGTSSETAVSQRIRIAADAFADA